MTASWCSAVPREYTPVVQEDRYRGFVIRGETERQHRGMPASVCYLSVYRETDDELVFGVRFKVRDNYLTGWATSVTPEQVTKVAEEAGLRWVHGLIDLERWTPTSDWLDEERSRGPMSPRNDSLSDEEIQSYLLRALKRMREAEGNIDYAPRLDVEGFADVLGVDVTRIRSMLSLLEAQDALVPYAYEKKVAAGNVRVTANGLHLLTELDQRIGAPTAAFGSVGAAVMAYLDDTQFRARYPAVHALWRIAVGHMEAVERGEKHLAGQVGYACRDTVQEFMDALVRMHQTPNSPVSRTETRNRLSALLGQYKVEIGESRVNFVAALFVYWRETVDLIQRQAKAAEREGELLTIDDARRVVLHTAVVMREIDELLPVSAAS